MSFLPKEERTKCWSARDKYWECLDSHEGNADSCKEFRTSYEQFCPGQWVKHFDRRYHFLKFKNKIETEGFEKFDSKQEYELPKGKSKAKT
ncbi:cytochrome c oxidase assembly factor 6 homolog isoform X2 [Diaphorina citri]|uniref:Cytochrome c oxidase assembly factor 6 homolog isoform X1 n=1 Tax=Diaphorina citri TaxID=121845 RepID=A0A1S4EDE7_DIACI|nr:cytochrome c oxidase assembly factor 6 homolog isoform X2 [Diaphorina citri]XP_026680405.1 cytochrome c oxidase assembly factor 6 homolog isoform X1 [Diaphorina citri]XP_026680406.1 cytochrome c oxidase assembly factor 6 homolog isoform X2 [Diaphorina citri]